MYVCMYVCMHDIYGSKSAFFHKVLATSSKYTDSYALLY